MPNVVNYQVVRGLPWSRQICVKNRRTHWRIAPETPNAFIQVSTTNKKEITAELMGNNNIRLSLTADETTDLPEGNLAYDVWATVDEIYQPIAQGKVFVSTYNTVTPSEDTDSMEIRYKQRTDYRRVFTWKDEEDDVLVVQDAFLQAKNSAGTTVLDLRWYESTPLEATVIALSPANTRGYLAPSTGATLEMHISNANTIDAGSYDFDLFVKGSTSDWECLTEGTLVVERSISTQPS